jgi:putative N-acetyltransferase (TIGR04045 family)
MISESVPPFRSQDIAFHRAVEPWEIREYRRLRERIFCTEQRLFAETDRDEVDEHAIPLVAVARMAGVPDLVIGVVRIWQDAPASWWGGRLGTHADHRRNGIIGPGLVRLAVGTACRLGCAIFRATVQVRNVPLFERLAWKVTGETQVCGQRHALMDADLAFYREAAS